MSDPPDLADLADFTIGAAQVKPSTREVRVGDHVVVIEPRVMQLLVVLAKADGAVVSRDSLVDQCWGGRAISEDALNRAIAKVRAVGSGIAADSFQVETIVKVGYRLLQRAPDGAERTAHHAASTSPPRRAGLLVAGLIGLGCATLAGSYAVLRTRPPNPPTAPVTSPVVAAAADLETRGLSSIFEGTPERTEVGIGYLRQATAVDPKRASLWGSLAMGYVLSLSQIAPGDETMTVARIREAAARARALDQKEGRSAAALLSLLPTFQHWAAKDAALEAALRAAPPRTAPLMFQRVQFLSFTGRTREALAVVEELNAVSPLLPWIQSARANLMAANDRPEEAQRVAETASKVWPRERLTWFTRFYLYAFQGQPSQALAMAADRSEWPANTDVREVDLAVMTARALLSNSVRDANRTIERLGVLAPESPAFGEQAIRTASALGKPAEALRFAEMLYGTSGKSGPRGLLFPKIGAVGSGEHNTAPLFFPPAALLWQQPGFMPLMSRIGLVAYWRAAKAPDLCRDVSVARRCAELGLGKSK